MTRALLAGLVASSSLLVGAAIALRVRVTERILGVIMAFGVGVLISAVAYDLVAEAYATSEGKGIPFGLFLGSFAFFGGDFLIDRAGGSERKSPTGGEEGGALAIVLGTILDGIPESVVLGLSLLAGEGVSLTVLIAVFLSNLPEAMAASTGLAASGRSTGTIYLLWATVVAVSGASAAIGYGLLGDAAPATIAFVQAFAAGAILTMLADTMMPEAFEHSGLVTGLVTTFGFAVAFMLATLERG